MTPAPAPPCPLCGGDADTNDDVTCRNVRCEMCDQYFTEANWRRFAAPLPPEVVAVLLSAEKWFHDGMKEPSQLITGPLDAAVAEWLTAHRPGLPEKE